MSWSYDNTNLTTTTATGRLNAVRLLIGDIDTNNQLLQDEEIEFGLGQNNDRVYHTAVWCCEVLASKYSVDVDIELDSELHIKYSQLSKQFARKAVELRETAKRVDGNSLGIKAGGISVSAVKTVRDDTTRVRPAFFQDQFANPPSWPDEYLDDYS